MSNTAAAGSRRAGARMLVIAVLCAGAAAPAVPGTLAAQVGHDPAHSPFRDILTRQSLTVFAGRFGGNTADAGVGARSSLVYGGRFRTRLSGPIDLMATVTGIPSKRLVINPSQPVGSRESGPVDQTLIAADLGLSLSLTGTKSWHRMAPYLGIGLGVIVPSQGTTDPGGYKVSTNFTFVPTFGIRFHAGRRYGLQVEVRDNTIRYEWPSAYFVPVDANGNALPPVLDPLSFKDRDLTHNLTLSVGLSYHFNF